MRRSHNGIAEKSLQVYQDLRHINKEVGKIFLHNLVENVVK